MRHLERLPEPQILVDKKAKWLDDFLKSKNKRPDSSKYAHKTIRNDLNAISSHKCFYCETKLKGLPKEVDHHIEVSVDETKSFDWENLYLSCDNCNGKIDHNRIDVNSCLNPFISSDEKIFEHLTFEKELIVPKNDSSLGQKTISKFRLDSELLDHRRLKQISLFQDVLLTIKNNQIKNGRKTFNEDELYKIKCFIRSDNPYTLMFKILLTDSHI